MLRRSLSLVGIAIALLATGCQSAVHSDVEAALYNPEQAGIRWGLLVADINGDELLAIRADDRFTPASNVKVITSMATYHHMSAVQGDAINPGTTVFLEPSEGGEPPNLILRGGGDAMLSDRPDCEVSCLATLADAVAAAGITEIASVIGDDTLLPFERWGPGWSVEDLQFYYGTAVSALSVNDNLVWVDIQPGTGAGDAVTAAWQDGDAYYDIENEITTDAADADRAIRVERFPGARMVRLHGSVPARSARLSFGLAIDNPAEFTALRFQRLLQVRGIKIGGVASRHRPLTLSDEAPDPEEEIAIQTSGAMSAHGQPIATLAASPLAESLLRISKDSENLHAEIALRRLGLIDGTGSRSHGVAALKAFLVDAEVSDHAMAVHDGSGMSVYNRISPRGMVALLSFAARQDWFEAWRADQPIGGRDGSLERRFKGTSLEGKIFAKTGTLNGANALSGIMIAASGRELLFSIIANDRPASTRSAISEMDAALVLIADAY